jgi:hypothetical protein
MFRMQPPYVPDEVIFPRETSSAPRTKFAAQACVRWMMPPEIFAVCSGIATFKLRTGVLFVVHCIFVMSIIVSRLTMSVKL